MVASSTHLAHILLNTWGARDRKTEGKRMVAKKWEIISAVLQKLTWSIVIDGT